MHDWILEKRRMRTMKGYVELFVLPVPKKNLPAYCRISQRFGKLLKEYGALEYREFLGVDLKVQGMTAFPSNIKLRPGEVLVSAVLGFRSKKHRDQAHRWLQGAPRAKRRLDRKSERLSSITVNP